MLLLPSTPTPQTYREALLRSLEHAHHPPDELLETIEAAYGEELRAFAAALSGDAYERALTAAEDGHSEVYIAALILALLIDYRAGRAGRAQALAGAVEPTQRGGFEDGARRQLRAWGLEPSFALTDPTLLSILAGAALSMARIATLTHERHLAAQAARSALEGARRAQLASERLPRLTTEIAFAAGVNEGRQALAQRSLLGDYEKVWQHGPSGPLETRRPHHAALEGVRVPRGGLFNLGSLSVRHPHDWERAGISEWGGCVAGDTLVNFGHLEGATRRWYEGEVIVVKTAGGNELTLTPNHPVLTDSGFISANRLDKGAKVVKYLSQREASTSPDVVDVPPRIKEIHRAATVVGSVKWISGLRMHFHGDGCDGEVEVVSTNGLLRNGIKTPGDQPGAQFDLMSADKPQVPFARGGAVKAGGEGLPVTAQGVMSSLGKSPPSTEGKSAHALDVGILNAAQLHPALLEHTAEGLTAEIARLGEGVNPLAGVIALDEIVDIVRDFRALHVYNLSTLVGYYVANSIIVHNCHCFVAYEPAQGTAIDPWRGV